eukprot:Nk52_evm2s271 gene=Nk52_evmTU2s271
MSNRFDLLVDENEDPEEAAAKMAQMNVGGSSSSSGAKKSNAPAKRTSADSARKPTGSKPSGPVGDYHAGERDNRHRNNHVSGGARGGRGGRPPKRDFERRSGSDKSSVKAEEKRDGTGKYNWGKSGEEEAERNKDAEGEDRENEEVEEEEEEVQMTLDEYKKKLESERPALSLPSERKANEGSDDKKWKNAKQIVKGEEEVFFVAKEVNKPKKGTEKKAHAKETLEVNFKFNETHPAPSGGRGGRGGRGRGGPRGGGASRGGFAGRRNQAPNVNDRKDFPTLS